ncbi:MAG: molecular chaperone TorD family protein [Thermodesulfobacteriota bacterium]
MRDFFLSRDAADLAAAYKTLAGLGPAPDPGDWEAVEFAFNRLFVGPMKLAAPPYASVYLDPEPRVMGESTLQARRVYQALGLESPWEGRLPDDHISLELDACLHFQAALAKAPAEELSALWRYFILEHLGTWVPRFVDRVREAPLVPAPIVFVIDQLVAWLDQEMSAARSAGKVGG